MTRIARQIRRTRLVRVLKKPKRPFALWPLIAAFARPFRGKTRDGGLHTIIRSKLRRQVPAWTLVVLLIVGAGVGFYASTILGAVGGTGGSGAPDFTLGANPGSMSVPEGQIGTFVISMTSLNGFAGSVNLNVTATPNIGNATLALNPGSVSLFTGLASASLTIPVPSSASIRDYSLIVTGVSGRLTHRVTLILDVTPPPSPDFQVQAGQMTINFTQGSSGSVTITLTSIGGFSGIVNVGATISPNGGSSPGLSVNPNRVTLLSAGTAGVVLTIATSGTTSRGSYSIIVQGVSGSLSNTASISLTVF